MAIEQNELFWAYVKAASPLTDPSTLSLLACCEWAPVRRRVAGNRHTPLNVLEFLSVDQAEEVRVALACNPSTPLSVVDRLVHDEPIEVRLEIAKNPDAQRIALDKLIRDDNSAVRGAAQVTLRLFHAPGTSNEVPLAALEPIFPPRAGFPPDQPMRSG